jgi:prevent-host-death family protein
MRLSDTTSISQFKSKAPEILAELEAGHEPVAITSNGRVVAVLQDVHSFEAAQETMALLKILALGNAQIEAGNTIDAGDAIAQRLSTLRNKSSAKSAVAAG